MQSPCAHHAPPLYFPGATRPRKAFSRLTSRFRVASYCRRVDLVCDSHGIGGGGKHCADNDAQPAHRRLRQALRRQRCTARPLFTSPAWPRRALRSHHYQRAPRKLSVHVVALCVSCPPLYCPGSTRGDRGVRYARTIVNAHRVS